MSSVLSSARPRLLAAALVASSLALAVPVVAVGPTSAAPVPRPVAARMTSVALSPAAPDQAARAGSVTAEQSSVVETGGGLRVVGVTWATGDVVAGDRVEIRERTNGEWGGWSALETEDDHAPDPGTAEAGNNFQQVREIAEIAVAPVAARADTVKLHRQDPAFPSVALKGELGFSCLFTRGSRLIAAGGQRLDDPADRTLVGVPATALDIEIARLDAPARRQFGQIHENFMPE